MGVQDNKKKLHQKSGSKFFTSKPADSEKGGWLISSGTSKDHTTHVYNKSGDHVKTVVTGDGGPLRDLPPGKAKS